MHSEKGHALTRKFRKIQQFGAFWCILYFNQTSMKFTPNDSAARKHLINNVTLSLTNVTMIKIVDYFRFYKIA